MRISTDARESEIEPAVNWISGLIGAAVDKRVLAFDQSEHKNPLLITSHFRDNFPLECALAKARKYKKKTGRLPKGDEFDLLYSFLVSAQRIRAELPQAAISRFEGALRGALKDSSGLRPFAYEVGIAAHLLRPHLNYCHLATPQATAGAGTNTIGLNQLIVEALYAEMGADRRGR